MSDHPLNVVTVVQARMASSRLSSKVMLPLLGQPVLARMLERVCAANTVGTVVVATTTDARDDVIEWLCIEQGIPCFRGHPTDLLDRHVQVALWLDADVVVKIPSDCPLIDPAVIDRVIGAYLTNEPRYDYVSNLHPASYPDGNDVEVMSIDALLTAWREAEQSFEREHTTPFIWERPERFRIGNVAWETGGDLSMTHRWVLDYAQDYEFVFRVYEALYPRDPFFGLHDVLELVAREPEIMALNAAYTGVNWYRDHLHELRTISADQTRVQPWMADRS